MTMWRNPRGEEFCVEVQGPRLAVRIRGRSSRCHSGEGKILGKDWKRLKPIEGVLCLKDFKLSVNRQMSRRKSMGTGLIKEEKIARCTVISSLGWLFNLQTGTRVVVRNPYKIGGAR